ncbi:zwei Ig domain protein zig-8-like isoform X2 [Euwallacea fornicatus]|uniref:zwei Ig domain protein zig-8-like isoform X2 n=1 Tax=Euwallacea fornicatus TaxID=995702 RepID=UPI00338FC18B
MMEPIKSLGISSLYGFRSFPSSFKLNKSLVATQLEASLDSGSPTPSTTTLPEILHTQLLTKLDIPETKTALGAANIIRESPHKAENDNFVHENRSKPHFHLSDSRFGGPFFEEGMEVKNTTARVGQTINLDCRVGLLGDKTVTWTQRRNQNINLLTVGRNTHSKDERFNLVFRYPNNYKLHISYVTTRDDGIYECQVATHPPKIKRIYLKITAPDVKIVDESMREIQERHYRQGSSLLLTCLATNLGLSAKEKPENNVVSWKYGARILNKNSRLNVTAATDSASSILTIPSLEEKHSGNYTCAVGNLADKSVVVHVLKGELPAAVQASGIQFKTLDLMVLLIVAILLYSTG